MTFESVGLLIVAIYIWLPPASYVVFLTTLVRIIFSRNHILHFQITCKTSKKLHVDPHENFRLYGIKSAYGGVDKNFNLGHNFQTIEDRAFIFHMCIPYDNTFHMVP